MRLHNFLMVKYKHNHKYVNIFKVLCCFETPSYEMVTHTIVRDEITVYDNKCRSNETKYTLRLINPYFAVS